MYDAFSADYDRFVGWEARLAAEMPFIERQLQAANACRILDAACGTGMHAIALAERGYEVAGADLSAGMIERARHNAADAGVDVRFEVAGFGELSQQIGGDFGAVLCLGNSLPHVLTPEDLAETLADFAACLHPGGLLLIQNRNFDAVLVGRERSPERVEGRWMSPQTHQESEREWLFLRFYDFDPDGLVTFNVVRLRREKGEDWSQQVTSTRLWPQTREELTGALAAADFEAITCFGDLQSAPFHAGSSPNLVMTARCTV